jgi:hypothetical protein
MGQGLVGSAVQARQVRVVGGEAPPSPTAPGDPRSLQLQPSRSEMPAPQTSPPSPTAATLERRAVERSAMSMPRASYPHLGVHVAGVADLIDAHLMRQIRGALGDSPVMSLLVQPLVAEDDKVRI